MWQNFQLLGRRENRRKQAAMAGRIGLLAQVFFLGCVMPALAGDVSVTVSGIVPNGTNVYVALCTGSLEPSSCSKGDYQKAQSPSMKFLLKDVTPARYAVAAYQDLDGNGYMERSKLGLPLEPYAFSNDAGRSRKPTIEAAEVTVGPKGRDFQLTLRTIKSGTAQ